MPSLLVRMLETITVSALRFHQSAMLSGNPTEISRPLKAPTYQRTAAYSQTLFNSTAPCLCSTSSPWA